MKVHYDGLVLQIRLIDIDFLTLYSVLYIVCFGTITRTSK